MRLWQWIVALFLARRHRDRPIKPADGDSAGPESSGRIVPAASPERRAETIVVVLLGIAMLFAAGFIFVYAWFSPTTLPNELLGISLGGALLFIGAALTVVAKRLVVTEELEEDYPSESPEQQHEVAEILHESGSRITRKRLLRRVGLMAGGTLGLAALTPALSLGPVWDTGPLDETPWRRGVRLVDEDGHPIRAADILHKSFYTAFPEHANPDLLGSPLVVLRLNPRKLRLPIGRGRWAPGGILAYSKICTHAGCAVSLYRNPLFTPVEPNPALVCPCHYSTFDPFTGGTVMYGPAGRPLPQLPLMVDSAGYLRAAGNFSGRVGPGWLNVRKRPT
jgi:ubiquinol-cytochrome c reductase iron-sulfur subunit